MKNYKERNEELHDLFSELLCAHQVILENIGELRAENEIFKGMSLRMCRRIAHPQVDTISVRNRNIWLEFQCHAF